MNTTDRVEDLDFKVDFTANTLIEEDIFGWIACLDKYKIVVTGKTKEEAFGEVLKSLAVLLAYTSGISSKELTTALQSTTPTIQLEEGELEDFEHLVAEILVHQTVLSDTKRKSVLTAIIQAHKAAYQQRSGDAEKEKA